MPIYAYQCESCGFAKDALQKLSDPPLVDCPSCGLATFKKQVTAAGFQLKGSGWYVTDFKGGGNAAQSKASTGAEAATGSDSAGGDSPASAEGAKVGTASEAKAKTKTESKTESKAATASASGTASSGSAAA